MAIARVSVTVPAANVAALPVTARAVVRVVTALVPAPAARAATIVAALAVMTVAPAVMTVALPVTMTPRSSARSSPALSSLTTPSSNCSVAR